ncbi:MAG TPA: cytochrome c [Terracidiphilus sp.]|nr:cytochrome c [Terracidiphilus sp.]
MVRFLIGIVIGILLVPAGMWIWLRFGNVPVAVSDPPLPMERRITGSALNERVDREMVQTPPIQPDETNLVAGAHIYVDKCAVCHGLHGKKAEFGEIMFPGAPPLWEKHHNGSVVGVSDDPPGETYWKVYNGIRLTGMPSFKSVLNETQMWQVSLLLANADKPLPPEAVQTLRGSEPVSAASPAAPAKK